MKTIRRSIATALTSVLLCASAVAADYAYMSNAEPGGVSANVDAMNAAFGTGNWDKLAFGSSIAGYKFVYVEGGDNQGAGFRSYVTANMATLESFVSAGGSLFLNAASNGLVGVSYALPFGASTREAGIGYSDRGYAADAAHPLFANGAGTEWYGTYFAHNVITTAPGFTTFITGDAGQTVLAGGVFGAGYLMVGGMTSSNFHSGATAADDPWQLRSNVLDYTANAVVTPVPEPETYALMLIGLGLIGAVARRRRTATLRAG